MFSPEQYRALRDGAGLVDRSDRGRLRLTGKDRRDYLQGLLTNDIAALSAGSGCYACLLTAQGRMIADMYVVETGEADPDRPRGDVTPRVPAHLEQFVFSEDVEVADVSASRRQLGVFGPLARLSSRVRLPSHDGGVAATSTPCRVLGNRDRRWSAGDAVIVVRRDDLGVDWVRLWSSPREQRRALRSALRDAGARRRRCGVAEVRRVESGRPVFGKDMTEDTIPLEAGIEDRAISLTKGCYVGQEIIIRVLHRGHGRVARRLVGLTFEPEAAVPAAGDADPLAAIARSASVTSAALSPALGRPIAIGYVHRDFVEPGTAVTVDAVRHARRS